MKLSLASWSMLVLCLAQWVHAATVQVTAVLTWANRTVAGVTRPVILTNGQYPGPTLWLNQGDNVQFQVTNRCPFNVSVHFHGEYLLQTASKYPAKLGLGIEQIGTPWSDGVPGVSQVSIQQGRSFLYRWTADQYGSYFYHAHHRGQLEDGLYGPIYIAPSSSEAKPFNFITNNTAQLQAIRTAETNTRPVVLSDWRLLTSEQIWAAEEASGVDSICANALLINGKGSVTCFSRAQVNNLTTPNQRAALGNETLTDIALVLHFGTKTQQTDWIPGVSLRISLRLKATSPITTAPCYRPCSPVAHLRAGPRKSSQ